MESSPKLFYCFSPSCQQSAARVLSKERATKLHLHCQGWVIPEDTIIDISELKLPFDNQIPLTFSSHPIATQAYLCSNQEAITSFLTRYTKAVRHQVLRELDLFDEYVDDSLKKMFDFGKYKEINELASQESLSSDLKSMRLAQLLKTPLPLYEDARLPNINNSELLITNLRRDLAKLFELKEVQPIPKIEVKLQNLDGLSPVKRTASRALTPFKDKIKRERNQIDQLWLYMKKNCNLNTAAKIMGQPLQKFYDQGNEDGMSKMKCCMCDFVVELKTKTKPQTNSACAYAILEHLYAEHPTMAMQNYNFTCGSVISLSFQTLLMKFKCSDISSITIIDSLSLPNIQKLHIEESDFQFQITHEGHKPIFRRVFLKGGNSKSMMALFGLVISFISITLKKKLTIYTSELKTDILKTFCQFYSIENVKVLSGNEGESCNLRVLKEKGTTE